MGVRFPFAGAQATVPFNALPANANETAVMVSAPFNPSIDSAQILILWYVCLTVGTGTTFIQWHVRRGSGTGGTTLNAGIPQQSVTAGQQSIFSGMAVDSPGAVGGQQYTLTIVQTAATAAANWQEGVLALLAL